MHWGDKRCPFLHFANSLPLYPNKLYLDSSLKWTIFYCSSVHTICSVAKSRRTFWFFLEIKGVRYGIRATNFSLFNLRETVFQNISFPVCSPNVREIDVAVDNKTISCLICNWENMSMLNIVVYNPDSWITMTSWQGLEFPDFKNPQKGVMGITLNYIRWWGSSSQHVGKWNTHLLPLLPPLLWSRMIIAVSLSYIDQIQWTRFPNHLTVWYGLKFKSSILI